MTDLVVVRSKIKEHTKLHVAGDFAEALNEDVVRLIKKAEERAKSNNRGTIKPRDL